MTPDQINKLLHAYATDGACWHEWVRTTRPDSPILIYKCIKCGELQGPLTEENGLVFNPSYSAPDNFKVLKDKFFGDTVLWKKFWKHYWHKETTPIMYDYEFTAWLFSDYSRFCSLFAEFLCLESTIKEFGLELCPQVNCVSEECKENPECAGTGKLKKAWAILAGEMKS